ncbi:ORF-15 [Agrotis segetum nucleopolyhedrovirus A]|uniref:ORF-15 n=1 Tax=Agrotis segetum nuclear polyhedrosis virus TaxID=1962501 RepID=Q287Q7_NPVAS|nr:ORF-15 [Agrotis segetum nucleopolyhedrovirus A]AAZ38181.1 ORF-15 [Agrotis segetum nucleopolyhedrovirus A]
MSHPILTALPTDAQSNSFMALKNKRVDLLSAAERDLYENRSDEFLTPQQIEVFEVYKFFCVFLNRKPTSDEWTLLCSTCNGYGFFLALYMHFDQNKFDNKVLTAMINELRLFFASEEGCFVPQFDFPVLLSIFKWRELRNCLTALYNLFVSNV